MIIYDVNDLEKRLEKWGYKKITSCKSKFEDEYEWYKAFYRADGVLKYQIFFEFWCWEKYRTGEGWAVSVCVMPESCEDYVGRRDLELSVDWADNIGKIEEVARRYYNFITEMDALVVELDGDPVGRRGRNGVVDARIARKAEEYQRKLTPPYDADDIITAFEDGMIEGEKADGKEVQ